MFREENENYKIRSHGRARKNEPNSHENSRDREFSLVSVVDAFLHLASWRCINTLPPGQRGYFHQLIPHPKPHPKPLPSKEIPEEKVADCSQQNFI